MADAEYDVIVLGAGPVGENVADRAVQGGLSAALVESELVGGECSYWACMPSKALLRSGQAVREAHRVAGAAEAVTGRIDVEAVLARRNSFTHDWKDDSQVAWAEHAGITVVRGHGRISGPKRVTATAPDGAERSLTARQAVVVAVGTEAAVPDVDGLRASRPWTSREATGSQSVPGRLAVIGGGVVAVEMATAYADLGSKVTVIARSGLLRGLEPFAGELVGEGLRGLGVELMLGAAPTRVARTGAGVEIQTSEGITVVADEVLAATGRSPRTADIGLDSVGLVPGSWLTVDDTLRVEGFDWLYAVGDVNHRALLTHQGKYQARAAGDAIVARAAGAALADGAWGAHVATADHAAVPQVVFSDPEVAAVGLTESAARDAGMTARVVDYDLGGVAGAALFADGYAGRARMVVDEDRRVIVGATFVGSAVAELLHAATTAVVGEVPIERLWHAVPAYPTVSEVWLRLLEAYRSGA
ncbi:NAD(P)/FAD-dependent oxidoreductase [Tsukamurella sp. 1534]|uniref:dihydrolipoyl dehydrogenase family protein n=1 Tax=Tsukamurella sp. 1534 TaxID=1151061 RepID=UPI0002D5A963|nr:NAD(P)/FAD-dependent oxidoreductase [Tsukamurella sp. 1534]